MKKESTSQVLQAEYGRPPTEEEIKREIFRKEKLPVRLGAALVILEQFAVVNNFYIERRN